LKVEVGLSAYASVYHFSFCFYCQAQFLVHGAAIHSYLAKWFLFNIFFPLQKHFGLFSLLLSFCRFSKLKVFFFMLFCQFAFSLVPFKNVFLSFFLKLEHLLRDFFS